MSGILGTRVFWATDVRYMNDPHETLHARQLVLKVLSNRLDAVSEALRETVEEHLDIPGFDTEFRRFGVCLCAERDLLSQWRDYTPEAKGVALSIPFSALRQHAGNRFALVRMLYDETSQASIVNTFVDGSLDLWKKSGVRLNDDNILGTVGELLIQSMLGFKITSCSTEQEWRLLLVEAIGDDANTRHHADRAGIQVPHVELPFLDEYLHEVMIGPEPYCMDEAIPRRILDTHGMGHIEISHSKHRAPADWKPYEE